MKKVLLSVVISVGLLAGSVSLADATSDWGDAIPIPDLVALNTDGLAEGTSVSCSSAGNCAATGRYTSGEAHWGFVVNQTNGVWGSAIPIPGLVDLNTGGVAAGNSVSCSSAGNCAVTGYYSAYGNQQGFVVNQTDGVWGDAIAIPGLGALNTNNNASGNSVSCPSAGNCAVTGFYRDGAGQQGFVVNQTDGVWGSAIPIPGLVALNTDGLAEGNSVSCSSAGNCAVTGYYTAWYNWGFVVNQTDGVWGLAIDIPDLAELAGGHRAEGTSVSCPSAGNCAVTGYYDPDGYHGFVVNQTDGVWGDAIAIPGLDALGNEASGNSVSCPSDGNCAVTGYSRTVAGAQGFVVNQTDGVWGSAVAIPGLIALNTGNNAIGRSVSCSSAGNCAVTGYYRDGVGDQGFVVNQTDGVWGSAIAIPGLVDLNIGNWASANSVSCPSAGNCAVTGGYRTAAGFQGFVVNLGASISPVVPVVPVVLTFTG